MADEHLSKVVDCSEQELGLERYSVRDLWLMRICLRMWTAQTRRVLSGCVNSWGGCGRALSLRTLKARTMLSYRLVADEDLF